MKIVWDISERDKQRVHQLLAENQNIMVQIVTERNKNREQLEHLLKRDNILHKMMMCLITSQQPSGPDSTVANFLRKKPFPITEINLRASSDKIGLIRKAMLDGNLNRFITIIPERMVANFERLEDGGWARFEQYESKMNIGFTKEKERELANQIAEMFKGFGPKQSRNLIQSLGISRYEVPIDSRITKWLNENLNLPFTISAQSLQIKEFYELMNDGIQELGRQCGEFPCVIDAAIFSSSDNGGWTRDNFIY
jgi:hypothetical protein